MKLILHIIECSRVKGIFGFLQFFFSACGECGSVSLLLCGAHRDVLAISVEMDEKHVVNAEFILSEDDGAEKGKTLTLKCASHLHVLQLTALSGPLFKTRCFTGQFTDAEIRFDVLDDALLVGLKVYAGAEVLSRFLLAFPALLSDKLALRLLLPLPSFC